MPIKNTMRYYFIPLRWLLQKKKKNPAQNIRISSVGEDVQKLEHLCTNGGNVKGASSMENSMAVYQKIKNKITV